MYYKIIGPKFCFRDICPDDIDVLHIPQDTVFTSPFTKNDEYLQQSDNQLCLDLSYIHFANGAFNAMMWYTWLFEKSHVQNNQIYKISPLTKVTKNRCSDEANLYQYGAHSIKILAKCDTKQMYDMAVAEFYKNKSDIIKTYPNIKLQPIIKAWEKHKICAVNFR